MYSWKKRKDVGQAVAISSILDVAIVLRVKHVPIAAAPATITSANLSPTAPTSGFRGVGQSGHGPSAVKDFYHTKMAHNLVSFNLTQLLNP